MRLENFKNEVMDEVKKVRRRGGGKWSNLSVMEKEGLESLRERREAGELVCSVTDKSGRWTCDRSENYKEACVRELDAVKTPMIDIETHNLGERELNSHATALLRMLGLEEGKGTSGERLRLAVQAKGTGLAPFYGLRKDHKGAEDLVKGPRVRPICGAEECSTRRVSYLLCQLLSPIVSTISTNCVSTEGLLREIEMVNRRGEADKRWVVGSLDVKSLYPSLDVQACAVVVTKVLMESDLQFSNLKWKEVGLYLRYVMESGELDCWAELLDVEGSQGLSRFLPKRITNRRPPLFEASGSAVDPSVRYGPWEFPEEVPQDDELRSLFCIAVGVMVKRTMELHDFCIDGKIHRQREGGSIGLDLTGVVADIFMGVWDKLLLDKLDDEGVKPILYMRYKDDVDVVLEVVGWGENDSEIGVERDKRVMDRFGVVADGVHHSIKVEVDSGYNHSDRGGRVPILDVEVWIGQDTEGGWRIMHSHYMKDVASRMVMNSRSAHGMQTKKNVMVNEVYRILRNCSVFLPWAERASRVSYYVKRMEYCGYEQSFRAEVVKAALKRYRRKLAGGCLFGEEKTEKERIEQREAKMNWYKKDGRYDSVVFVQPTVDSVLKRKVQQIARRNRVRIKVVEKAGVTVKQMLQKSNPFAKRKCERVDCGVCKMGRPGECRTRGCGYELVCKEDGRKYIGQTGRSMYERFNEELRDWGMKEEGSPLWKHSERYHQGQDFEVEVKVKDKCFGKPSRRLITESVLISQLDSNRAMNSKNEWTCVKLDKVSTGMQLNVGAA